MKRGRWAGMEHSYYVIDGAGHGFHGTAFEEAKDYIFRYLQEMDILQS